MSNSQSHSWVFARHFRALYHISSGHWTPHNSPHQQKRKKLYFFIMQHSTNLSLFCVMRFYRTLGGVWEWKLCIRGDKLRMSHSKSSRAPCHSHKAQHPLGFLALPFLLQTTPYSNYPLLESLWRPSDTLISEWWSPGFGEDESLLF